ncbi:ferric iron reductase protein FhuF [Achromobacter xylosoxidans A8]|uniref:Ferric iron reductase protein FhuF n=1 Tax=Achromobacter xylosoxidans (strain A8) TaxID=762376 RepID=E3HPT7_ACHXA|nr:siderophore-iron reductase FhuF [Achromobacter xylosoxidans]ADP15921.1 ferric iron reductase protein FhuF [Achromobacter xylosoxidans A8]
MIPRLSPLFQGDRAVHAETLSCAAEWPAGAISVAHLLGSDQLLGDTIRRYAAHLKVSGEGLRAAASAWSLDYLWALLPATAAAASVLRHTFPMRADDVALSLSDFGAPIRFHILHEGGPAQAAPPAVRYAPLLDAHLDPLFKAISRQTRLAQKILWGNTARYLEAILDQALALTGNAEHVAQDKQALLLHPTRPDGSFNPLFSPRRTSPVAENGVTAPLLLHRQCCLYYRLPGHSHCRACPLAPEHRAESKSADRIVGQ